MRVIFDISPLGLGHLYSDSRGGTYRVHRHLAEGLVASGECEVLFCANCSSVALAGCAEFLRNSPTLAGRPLLAAPVAASGASGLARRMHRVLRRRFPNQALPGWLRRGARAMDRGIHPPVGDADPPAMLFHSGSAPLPPRRPGGPRRILSIYDVGHLRVPGHFDPSHARAAQETVDTLSAEDWVITPSAVTRDDLCDAGLAAPERVFVVPLAADPDTFHPHGDAEADGEVRQRLGAQGPYLVGFTSTAVRKNPEGIVRALARLAAQEGVRDLTLLLVGQLREAYPPMAAALAEARAAGARVRSIGFVRDEELAVLYRGAMALVYPSRYEGFGLPLLEAMRCGTPVIAAAGGAIPEVMNGAGILVPPDDDDALAAAMLSLYRDRTLRDALRARALARAGEFTWERCTRETLDVYRAVLAA